jgi:hypothetical protein
MKTQISLARVDFPMLAASCEIMYVTAFPVFETLKKWMQWKLLKIQKKIGSPWRTISELLASVRSGPKYKIKSRSFGECLEVPVSREQRDTPVDTALGDQRITETRLAAPCQHLGSQSPCPLPVAGCDLD